jgi:hypothetical protein
MSTFEALDLDRIATHHSDGAHKVSQRWGGSIVRGERYPTRQGATRIQWAADLSNGQSEDVYGL